MMTIDLSDDRILRTAAAMNLSGSLSMDDSARALGVSVPTAYGLVRDGLLETHEIGRTRRVSALALAKCIVALEDRSRGRPLKPAVRRGRPQPAAATARA